MVCVLGRESSGLGDRGIVCAEIATQVVLTLTEVWQSGRRLRRSEQATFRILGAAAGRAGLVEDDAISAANGAIEAVLAVAREKAESARVEWHGELVGTALAELLSTAEGVAATVRQHLALGVESAQDLACGQAAVLARVVGDGVPLDQLAALAAEAYLDVTVPYGVVFVVHGGGDVDAVEATARDLETLLPQAIDLGFGDETPVHRRVMVAALTPGQWAEAREKIARVAIGRDVLAVSPAATAPMRGLAELATTTTRALPRVVSEFRGTSGIIDPDTVAAPAACASRSVLPVPAPLVAAAS
jgi:hypothetical protein